MANREENLRNVYFLGAPTVPQTVVCADKNETIQFQINIKGYENRKDQKVTKDIFLKAFRSVLSKGNIPN